jgi:hypothetical protein
MPAAHREEHHQLRTTTIPDLTEIFDREEFPVDKPSVTRLLKTVLFRQSPKAHRSSSSWDLVGLAPQMAAIVGLLEYAALTRLAIEDIGEMMGELTPEHLTIAASSSSSPYSDRFRVVC